MKKTSALILSLLLLLGVLTGCGASPLDSAKGEYNYVSEECYDTPSYSDNYGVESSGSVNTPPAGRKWIVTADISAETEDMDQALEAIRQRIDQFGGYIERQSTNGSPTYRSRYANLTIRVPADKVDAFLTSVGEVSNVTFSSKELEDVTLTYVDTESRVKALETEQTRLMELLAKAEDLADILSIEDRLSQVRYELESAASFLRVLSNQVDYATISLSVSEVKVYTPAAERTYWQRIGDGFAENLSGVWEFLQDFSVWLITSIPTLALLAVVIVPCVLLLRRGKKKKAAKRAELLAAQKEKTEG